jgi:hypothetical protein
MRAYPSVSAAFRNESNKTFVEIVLTACQPLTLFEYTQKNMRARCEIDKNRCF